MTSLADDTPFQFVKVLYIGDSGTGKTGSLASLVGAGYKLRIIDTDNGMPVLRSYIKRDYPDRLSYVDYETRRDKYVASPTQGPIISGMPKMYTESVKLLNNWTDGTKPQEWGPDTILVIDSLSTLAIGAFEWIKKLNPLAKEPRTWFYSAQQSLEAMLSMLTAAEFATNVILISHVDLRKRLDDSIKGYPNSIGEALGPIIGRYFNTFLLAETVGSGPTAKRVIKTATTGTIDLKNPAPFKIDAQLPLESGMATIFAKLKEKSE